MPIGDWLARREILTPDKLALVDTSNGNRRITYRQWNRAANRTAHFLRHRLGIGKGDRVAVLAMNCVEYLDIWFALGKLGAVLQNLNWRLTVRELSVLIADAGPTALIYGGDFCAQADELRPLLPSGTLVALDEKAAPDDLAFGEREGFPDSPPPEVELDWNAPWVICYTGGTTGTPKGAVLTHRSITANSVNTIVSWGLNQDDVAILDSPLFHTGGLNVLTAPLVHLGGTTLVCKRFDADQTFDLIRDAGVTLYFGVPTMFLALQQHPRWAEADFRRLRLLISGGAPCPMPVFEKFWARGVDFKTGYGLTEAGPNTFWLPPADVRSKPGAVGFPLFHVDVMVCRPDGTECGPDEAGELLIRGPHVCAGYWNDAAATAEAIRPRACDPGGPAWLHTGDLARRDAQGYYYIAGRLKDMIISGGENVYPAEVESVIHAHPEILEAAVIGVPDDKWGEVGRAIVALAPGAPVSEAGLLEFIRERLAGYKVPQSVVFVESLPKTGANKVDKKQLIERYGGISAGVFGKETHMPTLQSNGITLAYEIDGSGRPLLLIAGVGYGGWFWHKIVPRLAERFQVITFDNRGAGGSDKPDGPYTIPMMAADSAGLLDGLGIREAFVLGHSLGGFIAQELIATRPELVSRLILASTNHGGQRAIPITPEALQVLMDRSGDPIELVKRGIAVAAAPGFAERCPDVAAELLQYRLTGPVPAAAYGAQVMAGAGAGLYTDEMVDDRMRRIAVPTLILFGEHDKVVPPGNAELMRAKIADAAVRILPGVGHMFPLEDPAATLEALVEFLQ